MPLLPCPYTPAQFFYSEKEESEHYRLKIMFGFLLCVPHQSRFVLIKICRAPFFVPSNHILIHHAQDTVCSRKFFQTHIQVLCQTRQIPLIIFQMISVNLTSFFRRVQLDKTRICFILLLNNQTLLLQFLNQVLQDRYM